MLLRSRVTILSSSIYLTMTLETTVIPAFSSPFFLFSHFLPLLIYLIGMLGILEAIVSENHSIEELICNRNFKAPFPCPSPSSSSSSFHLFEREHFIYLLSIVSLEVERMARECDLRSLRPSRLSLALLTRPFAYSPPLSINFSLCFHLFVTGHHYV